MRLDIGFIRKSCNDVTYQGLKAKRLRAQMIRSLYRLGGMVCPYPAYWLYTFFRALSLGLTFLGSTVLVIESGPVPCILTPLVS